VAVHAPAEGLLADTEYHYRIAATSNGGTSHGADAAFTTAAAAPIVVTGVATSVGQSSAWLAATVNPSGAVVSNCELEYGLTTSYGASAACEPAPGAGREDVAVRAPVELLIPGTNYHYRVLATNAGGTSYGADASFTTTSPGVPELGRCLVTGQPVALYKTGACTTESVGGDSGRYEWRPWPLQADGFNAVGAAAKLETVERALITCASSRLVGEYLGSRLAAATITLSGCQTTRPRRGTSCRSEGAPAGQISTVELSGQLGVVKTGKKPAVGWRLSPAAGNPFARFDCGTTTMEITGSVIAPVSPVDKMTPTLTLRLKAAKGVQQPDGFVTGGSNDLTLHTGGSTAQLGLTMNATLTGAEAAEIKVIE